MPQRFQRRTSLLGIEVQAPIKQIGKKVQLLDRRIVHPLDVSHQSGLKIAGGLRKVEYTDDILLEH